MLVIVVVTSLAAFVVGGTVHSRAIGHPGPRVEGAIVGAFTPARHGSMPRPNHYTGDGPNHGRLMIYVRGAIQNVSSRTVVVQHCRLAAFGAGGEPLFTSGGLGIGPVLAPGEDFGVANEVLSAVVNGSGVTLADVHHADHYRVTCDAHRWVGPLPEQS